MGVLGLSEETWNSDVLVKLFLPQQFTRGFIEDDFRTIVKKMKKWKCTGMQSPPWVAWLSRQDFHTHEAPDMWGSTSD